MDTVFTLSPFLTVPFWLLIIFLPNWDWTVKIVSSPWIVAPMALLFSVLTIPHFFDLFYAPKLDNTTALLGTKQWATVVMAHVMAFDLFVGRWVYVDYRRRGYSAIPMGFMFLAISRFGPMAFLSYLIITWQWPGRGADSEVQMTSGS